MDLEEIVLKLTGPVDPIGDSAIDEKRLRNLKALCELTGGLVERIEFVANIPGGHMASVKAAKDVAASMLASLPVREGLGEPGRLSPIAGGPAHTDHPMRHYDRTCPACNPAGGEGDRT